MLLIGMAREVAVMAEYSNAEAERLTLLRRYFVSED